MIPEVLHQTWKSKTALPERFRCWRESFLELNPRFEFRLYDDADNRALLAETFPQLLPLYDSFPREIFRADFIRPVYLYRFGGFYADLDFQCLAPLSQLNAGSPDIVLGRMGTDDSFAHSIPNAFMAAAPNQAFWIGYLAHCMLAWQAQHARARIVERPERVTGPVVLHATVALYLYESDKFRELVRQFIRATALDLDAGELAWGDLDLLPGHVLYPVNWKDNIHREFIAAAERRSAPHTVAEARELFPGSIAVTYWAHSWGQ